MTVEIEHEVAAFREELDAFIPIRPEAFDQDVKRVLFIAFHANQMTIPREVRMWAEKQSDAKYAQFVVAHALRVYFDSAIREKETSRIFRLAALLDGYVKLTEQAGGTDGSSA